MTQNDPPMSFTKTDLKVAQVIAKENERIKDEQQTLREFDLNGKWGPAVGLTRLERWKRAIDLGLSPPKNVYHLLVDNNGNELEAVATNVLDEALQSISARK
ncbi:hypothetical protein E1B28_009423 [Marasmius oreades]|uniref:Uncharacterized protein n=1 Tax=Marasmius oreades TaxID=181124 RepID=A0A9P7UTE9_9AGAR|nr:uncharacterized protein E1B28_009423 [Marasmius oreades]KAG7093140.1 hypothetical protein E1B28_009423 [Marasmius oreades]